MVNQPNLLVIGTAHLHDNDLGPSPKGYFDDGDQKAVEEFQIPYFVIGKTGTSVGYIDKYGKYGTETLPSNLGNDLISHVLKLVSTRK